MRAPVLAHRATRLSLIFGLVVLMGCRPGGEETFSSAELHEGIETSVAGNDGTVQGAVAFHPGEDPMEVPEEHFRSLSQGEAVTVRNGLRDFDITVIYRTGPDCGLAPDVELAKADPPRVNVVPRNEGGGGGRDCPDTQFDLAVGFELREDVNVETVELHVQGR